ERGERRPEMQRPDHSVYAQQLEEHRLKQQREAVEAEARREAAAAQEPTPVAPIASIAEPPQAEAPRTEAPRPETPRVDPKAILEGSGLQMVETDSSKVRVQPPGPEPEHLGRPRRERPAAPEASEPLVQVETRK
ncbi:MAG: hypothetical protein AB1452_13340, partial [Pseudomonadota bacterium]